MIEKPATADRVVITAKRLDAEEAKEVAIGVEVPATEAGQRAQLIDLVHTHYPDAEFRSFDNEAASFLAHKILVVAVYRRAAARRDADPTTEDDSQQQLFAA